MEIRKLSLDDPTFPAVLREIPTPPQAIFVQGELAPLLARPRLAVVGSRKVSPYGYQVTRRLVRELVRYGVVIVSGLALGIDGIAHQTALDADGLTMAVLGGGLDKITPVINQPIAKQLLKQNGALISEYPPGQKAFRYSFVARNRLIIGLSDALLVTEAAINSGTRHTVSAALAQNKTILAVPGDLDSRFSEGTNRFIRDGALIVTEVNDILQALGLLHIKPQQMELLGRTPDETSVLKLIQAGEHLVSELQAKSGMNISLLNQTLTSLELAGKIYTNGGSYWNLR